MAASRSYPACGRGGTGRRATLRSLWANARGSSSLLDRTKQFLRDSRRDSSAHPAPEGAPFCGISRALLQEHGSETFVPVASQRPFRPMSLFGVPSPHLVRRRCVERCSAAREAQHFFLLGPGQRQVRIKKSLAAEPRWRPAIDDRLDNVRTQPAQSHELR